MRVNVQTAKRRGPSELAPSRRASLEREADRMAEAAIREGPRADRSLMPAPPAQPGGGAPFGGAPFGGAARERFERSYGFSFADVRIHADTAAAEQARALGARAFARGPDLYFARRDDLQGSGGRVLAHELAHVVQQRHQPDLRSHALCDQDDPAMSFDVVVDREMGSEDFLVELLRQHFGVSDRGVALAVIKQEQMDLGPDFRAKKGTNSITITQSQVVQIGTAVRQNGGDPIADERRKPKKDDKQKRPADGKAGDKPKPKDDKPKPKDEPKPKDDKPKPKDEPKAKDDKPKDLKKPPATGTGAEKVSKELADALAEHRKLMPQGPGLRSTGEDELEQLRRILAELKKLTAEQRQVFIDLAAPTDDLDEYERSVKAFRAALAGAEEALKEAAAGHPPKGDPAKRLGLKRPVDPKKPLGGKGDHPTQPGQGGTGTQVGGGAQGGGQGGGGGTGSGTGKQVGGGAQGGGATQGGTGTQGPQVGTDVEPKVGKGGGAGTGAGSGSGSAGEVVGEPKPGTQGGKQTTGGGGGSGGGVGTGVGTGTGDLDKQAGKQTGQTDVEELQQQIADTWHGVDAQTWEKMNAAQRAAVVRKIAAEQRNLQLKHMVTHPGQTVKAMAKGVVRVDQLAKDVGKDIDEVVNGKSTAGRAAAASSAAKKIAMWLSVIITIATIVAFIINPALAMKIWMMRALFLMLAGAALALVESELRLQQAIEADNLQAAQEAVAQAASAQAEFIAVVAMAAIPLAGRLLAKVPFLRPVVVALGKAKSMTAQKLWAARNAVAKQLRDIVKGSEAAVKAEGAGLAKVAADLEKMTGKEFLEALQKDAALREKLGFEEKAVEKLAELLNTAEGQRILDRLKEDFLRSVADAPNIAQRVVEDYNVKVEEAAKEIENAKTPDEAKTAVENAERLLGEREMARDLTSRGEDYKGFRESEAAEKARIEALDKAAEAQKAIDKAKADKAAADKAAADKAAAEQKAKAAEEPVATGDQPLQEVKPEEMADAAAAEASAGSTKRLSWDEANALKLDKRSVPSDVKQQGLTDLWKEWVDYVRARTKAHGKGEAVKQPLKWEAYSEFLGKFQRGRAFQRRFTKTLTAESGKGKTVEQDVGVVSEKLEAKVQAGEEGVKFADQVVADNAAVKKFGKGEGPAPEVETYSNKSRDFAALDQQGTLADTVAADVAEILTKYSGKITIRRAGPLKGVKVSVKKATLVYDGKLLPSRLIEVVKEAFKRASKGRVELRIE